MCLLVISESSRDSAPRPRGFKTAGGKGHRLKTQVFYWTATLLLAIWLLAGGIFDAAHARGAVAILKTLGYPEYLCTILGACKMLAVMALLYPPTRLLREWAYAGITFDALGAFVSHLAVRDGVTAAAAPLLMLSLAAVSYWLRPSNLRMRANREALPARPEAHLD
jgi:hypothetical protein